MHDISSFAHIWQPLPLPSSSTTLSAGPGGEAAAAAAATAILFHVAAATAAVPRGGTGEDEPALCPPPPRGGGNGGGGGASAPPPPRPHQTVTAPFSLTNAVRTYTGARLGTVTGTKGSVLQVELSDVYDILGMLRSLQYDVKLYNNSSSSGNNLNDSSHSDSLENEWHESRADPLERYARHRLERQAAACHVRLPSPPTRTVPAPNRNSSNNSRDSLNGRGGAADADADAAAEVVVVVVVEGLDALVQFVEDMYRDRIAHARLTLAQGCVDFDALTEYCAPGTLLLDGGLLTGLAATPTIVRCRACRVRRTKTATGRIVSVFEAAVECVVAVGGGGEGDHGGGGGGWVVVEAQWVQSEFRGTRSVRSDDYAADAADDSLLRRPTDAIVQELARRGRAYESFCVPPPAPDDGTLNYRSGSGIQVQYQAGTFWSVRTVGGGAPSSASGFATPLRGGGRMMVDPHEAWSRGVHPCKAPADGAASDSILPTLQSYARYLRQRSQPRHKEPAVPTASATSDGPDDVLLLRGPLPDVLVMLTWPVVCGFSLPARVWGLALVAGLSPVHFHTAAFDALVLPPARKRLLRALVASHGPAPQQQRRQQQPNSAFAAADVLPGKGEGLIILLYGPPGVGKTLTAEAVAEVLHRPLYRVSMGELGTTPENLESRLQEIFDLCLPWKAIVLLDEAEVLLETRSKSADLVRNAMVCVMLRLLEYYPGILFLTTNSGVELLDPAVASRITCALPYDALDAPGRLEIWRTSLARVAVSPPPSAARDALPPPPLLSDADLTALATEYATANGRQIKNAVQLASIVCRHEQRALTLESLRETLEMTATWTAPK